MMRLVLLVTVIAALPSKGKWGFTGLPPEAESRTCLSAPCQPPEPMAASGFEATVWRPAETSSLDPRTSTRSAHGHPPWQQCPPALNPMKNPQKLPKNRWTPAKTLLNHSGKTKSTIAHEIRCQLLVSLQEHHPQIAPKHPETLLHIRELSVGSALVGIDMDKNP